MNSKGYLTIETALTFPLFLILTVVLLFVLIMFVLPGKRASLDTTAFVDRIYAADSVKRKAEIINGIFE